MLNVGEKVSGYYLPSTALCCVGCNIKLDCFFKTDRKRITDGLINEIIKILRINPTPSVRREIKYYLRRATLEERKTYTEISGDNFGGAGSLYKEQWEYGLPMYYDLTTGDWVFAW